MFKRLLQRVLIIFFLGTSLVILVVGIVRIKKASISSSVIPAPGGVVPGSATPPAQGAQNGSGSYTGAAYSTPWGNVKVAISVASGKIVSVTTPAYPSSPPSEYAHQYLINEAIAAGTANIQGVSGATYTSLAFQRSLESAIAQAGGTSQGGQTSSPQTVTPAPSVPSGAYEDD